ncbi:unnamed protein product [Anisakis simplex]|uniref:Miff domain-containing protein n=1 Tax=Anisakis simplex TaxID=6269 RepID=A0A0M3K3S9_ANISI|nr:unnamed protein product [Anisakis simplex]
MSVINFLTSNQVLCQSSSVLLHRQAVFKEFLDRNSEFYRSHVIINLLLSNIYLVIRLRQSDDALLVSTCDSNITTDSNSPSSDQTIDELTFKTSPLPNLERQRTNQALSLLHSEKQQVSADVGSDTPTDGTFESLSNEGEKILWMAEERVTKTAEEIQAVLSTLSDRYVIIAIIIGVTLLGIAALLLYLKFTGCLGSSSNVRIQFPSTFDNERVTARGIELKEMVRRPEPTNATPTVQRPRLRNATPGILLQRPASIFSPLISPL